MKKNTVLSAVLLLVVTSWSATALSGGEAGTMNVQVREVIVKTTPNYMGSSAGKLTYGTEVEVVGEQGNWYQIARPSGWLPKGALTKHRVAVNADQKFAGRGTSHDEVALAGKGFNPQVEAQYKHSSAELAAAYATVDRVEGFGASETELKGFQAAGKLKPR